MGNYNIQHGIDSAADDSDKTIVVPDGEMWRLDWLHAILVSTATVGNRQITIALYDSANVLQFDIGAGAVQAASLTRHYMFQPGIFRETTFSGSDIQVAIPLAVIIPSKWYIRVWDSAAIAAAADDLTLNYQFTKIHGN